MTLSVIAGIVLVNLLVPYGRVLAEIGPLHITAGSLADGLRKAVTLEGLVMLSAAVISGRPPSGVFASRRKPGRTPPRPAPFRPVAVFGRLLGESLSVFAALREGRARVRPGHVIDDVDTLLMGMERPPPAERNAPAAEPVAGRLWLAAGLLITAALMALPFLLSRL
ncbi:MAG: hypothetical protein LBO76_02865 [Treponema sp.]|nr:hypothetical protein [Treponema sp.]